MQTKIICPHCSQKLRVDSKKFGKTIGCPACKQSFTFESGGNASALSLGKQANRTLEASDGSTLGSIAKSPERSDKTKRPRKLGRFEIVSVLGTGGFGKVYQARDPSLDRFVALKVPIFASGGENRIKRFVAEAKAAARLRHPNIVTTYESGKAGDRYYIATEYIEGELLSDRLERGRPSFSEAAEIVRKLALALHYAHSSGIVHRDLKPHNVMIDGNGEPQLMDFGLARRTDDDSNLTTDGSLLGTPAYMSPEQARGEVSKVDALSDQYSLGVVLYYLLTGTVPHEGEPYVIVSKVAMGDFHSVRDKNPEVDSNLDAICQKAMMPEREHRYQSCEQFASDLLAWSESRPVLARPMTRLQTWGHHAKKHKVAVGATLSVAIAMIAAGLFAFSKQRPVEDAGVASDVETEIVASVGAEKTNVDIEFASETQTKNRARPTLVPPTDDVGVSMGVGDIEENAPDIVFADFEEGSYGDWKREGFAFGNAPRNPLVTPRGAHHPWPMNGNFIADSKYAANGVCLGKFTGKLTSPPFKINRQFINFMGAARVEYVRVLVGGNVVETGKRNIDVPFDRISPVTLDVGKYLEQMAIIEIVDDGTGDDDHVVADCFVLSDSNLRDAWHKRCIEETQAEAIELIGRRYYVGPIPVTFENAKDLADVVGGRLLTVESEEEAMALVPHLKDAAWQGVRKEGGIWQNEDGDVYTHVDWGGHSIWREGATEGVPGDREENTLLTTDGDFRHVSDGRRWLPIIEFGPQQKPRQYQLTAPQENRKLAEYLIDSKANMIIATADRFRYDWFRAENGLATPLPDEAFEVQHVNLPNGFLVNAEVERLFEFDNRIRHLGIKNGNDDSLKVIPHLKYLRSLTIDRGAYASWAGLSAMERGHPLTRFHLRYVRFNADQILPLFRAKRLQQALFTGLRLSPEIGLQLAAHSDSLVELTANGAPGLGRRGFEGVGKLKQLRNAHLYGSDMRDEDLQHIGQLTSLRSINIGGNKRITGNTFHELAGWVNLESLAIFSLMDDGKLANLPPLPSLRNIDLKNANLSGASLPRLCQFPSLESIVLKGTSVDNAALQQLLSCERLRRLEVRDTKVTPEGLRSFFARIPGFSADVDQDNDSSNH